MSLSPVLHPEWEKPSSVRPQDSKDAEVRGRSQASFLPLLVITSGPYLKAFAVPLIDKLPPKKGER